MPTPKKTPLIRQKQRGESRRLSHGRNRRLRTLFVRGTNAAQDRIEDDALVDSLDSETISRMGDSTVIAAGIAV